MKQIFIRGKKTSLNQARKVTKQVMGNSNFESRYKRGEVQLYFPNYISEREVEIIAKVLKLKITKMSSVRAILD